tara:strand:- start:43 stop:441 length:399 start_codon:yes stop_codon:yes gene_type:complete
MPEQDNDTYMAGSTASEAAGAIDSAVGEGKSGTEILSMLLDSGIRVYTADEVGEESFEGGAEEPPMEEGMEEGMEEPPMEEPMEEGPENAGMPFEGPGEATPSSDGGMRDMRMAAVRFALDKDKENKEQAEA